MTDLNSSVADLVRCTICMEIVGQQKSLSCQHSFCVPCLQKLKLKDMCLSCPVCNRETRVPDGDIKKLQENMMVKELAKLVDISSLDETFLPVASQGKNPSQNITESKETLGGADDGAAGGVESQEMLAHFAEVNSDLIKQIDEQLRKAKSWTGINQERASKCIKRRDEIKKGVEKCVDELERVEKLCLSLLGSLKKLQDYNPTSMETEVSEQEETLESVREASNKLEKLKQELMGGEMVAEQLQSYGEASNIIDHHCAKSFEKPLALQHGSRVQLNPDYYSENLSELLGLKVPFTSVGVTHEQVVPRDMKSLKHNLWVIFPEECKFMTEPKSVIPTKEIPTVAYVGDRVRLRELAQPKEDVGANEVGILLKIEEGDKQMNNDVIVRVKFPGNPEWKGKYSEVEKVPGCGLEVGDEVRVNRFVKEPKRGWGPINGSSVGVVKEIMGESGCEEALVCFPECSEWTGFARELSLCREPVKGDFVQVKLSVEKQESEWDGVKHSMIGRLSEIKTEDGNRIGVVGFPSRDKSWRCLMDELETPRYQNHDDDEDEDENGVLEAVHKKIKKDLDECKTQ